MYNLKIRTGVLQYDDLQDDDFQTLLSLARDFIGFWWIIRLSDFVVLATNFKVK